MELQLNSNLRDKREKPLKRTVLLEFPWNSRGSSTELWGEILALIRSPCSLTKREKPKKTVVGESQHKFGVKS